MTSCSFDKHWICVPGLKWMPVAKQLHLTWFEAAASATSGAAGATSATGASAASTAMAAPSPAVQPVVSSNLSRRCGNGPAAADPKQQTSRCCTRVINDPVVEEPTAVSSFTTRSGKVAMASDVKIKKWPNKRWPGMPAVGTPLFLQSIFVPNPSSRYLVTSCDRCHTNRVSHVRVQHSDCWITILPSALALFWTWTQTNRQCHAVPLEGVPTFTKRLLSKAALASTQNWYMRSVNRLKRSLHGAGRRWQSHWVSHFKPALVGHIDLWATGCHRLQITVSWKREVIGKK